LTVIFEDNYANRTDGEVLFGTLGAPYEAFATMASPEGLAVDLLPISASNLAVSAPGSGAINEMFFLPLGSPVAEDARVFCRFHSGFHYVLGVPTVGPLFAGEDSDSMLLLRYQDEDNYIYIHPQYYTKRFVVFEVVAGVATSYDLGSINSVGGGGTGTLGTMFDVLTPLFWDVSIVGTNLSGTIKNNVNATLFSFEVELSRTSIGRAGFGHRRKHSFMSWGYFRVERIGSPELTAWDVSDDLPTEDVTQPNFVRKGLSITIPRSDTLPDDVSLYNPLLPQALYRGKPLSSGFSGGSAVWQLEPIEARWQRARPRKKLAQQGPFTGAQALTALLTARKTEFSFLDWNTIPTLYWPGGSTPSFPNLFINTDGDDRARASVYDELVTLIAAFPGYSLDFDPQDKLRVVIPPFAPNAPAAITVSTVDADWFETGYSKTDLVRSVRVRSQPYAFLDDPLPIAKPIMRGFIPPTWASVSPPIPAPTSLVYSNEGDYIATTEFINFGMLLPFSIEGLLPDLSTVKVDLNLERWRYLDPFEPPVKQLSNLQLLDVAIPNDGAEHNLTPAAVWSEGWVTTVPTNTTYNVYGKITAQGIEIRVEASLASFGWVTRAFPPGATYRKFWFASRLYVDVVAKAWQEGAAKFTGDYLLENGYLDLPDLDVSLLGVNDDGALNRLARLIAEYRSRQAVKWTLNLHQPWALGPTDKGRRVNLGTTGIQVLLDSLRSRIAYENERISAVSVAGAWQYQQFSNLLSRTNGDILARANGDVLEV
jgi:hypothetical protein